MSKNLNKSELEALVKTVFNLKRSDKSMAFFVDLPNKSVTDNTQWADTRAITYEWYDMLSKENSLGLDVSLYCFENVGANNSELPKEIYLVSKPSDDISIENLPARGKLVTLISALQQMDIGMAPTFFSCTAPMKMLATKHDFRAATMPGFTREMIPALGIDYGEVSKKVNAIKTKLDNAITFKLLLGSGNEEYESYFDLRFRKAHASTGLIHEPKTAGNLPSGEAYIVPYEGEREGQESQTRGLLPVEFSGEIVVYEIENNRAVSVRGEGKAAMAERRMLKMEPAYGNISEIGMGVLGEFGIKACGSLLLDEKLGLHVAFGRSEHFGGIVGPGSFNDPKKVVHIDRVYVKSLQPRIEILQARLLYEGGAEEQIRF